MKKPIFIVLILFYSIVAFSQKITFEKTFGGAYWDNPWSIKQTKDGGYIIVGSTEGKGPGNSDILLIKTNKFGDSTWTKIYGGKGNDDGRSVEQTNDGGFLITGSTSSFSNDGHSQVYLIKTLANGDTLWTRTYGNKESFANGLALTNDNGIIITGSYQTSLYLIKTNTKGDTLWTKIVNGKNTDSRYQGTSVQLTSDGGYIISGSDYGFNTGDVGTLLKISSGGDIIWSKAFTGWGNASLNYVIPTMDNGYITIGYTQKKSSLFPGDIILIKTNSYGDTTTGMGWVKYFANHLLASGTSIQPASNNGYIISGFSDLGNYTKQWLIRINLKGDTLWTNTYGENVNTSTGFAIETFDGGYAAVCANALYNSNNFDLLMIKTDSLGKIVTGIDEKTMNVNGDILIYPNPSSDILNIKFKYNQEFVNIKMYNLIGMEVYKKELNPNQDFYQLNISEFTKGIYFIQINSGMQIVNKKIFIQSTTQT